MPLGYDAQDRKLVINEFEVAAVPGCRACNAQKAERHFREFLTDDPITITAIEAHMMSQGYEPIWDHAQLRAIIELALQDGRNLADRYVAIINTVLTGKPDGAE